MPSRARGRPTRRMDPDGATQVQEPAEEPPQAQRDASQRRHQLVCSRDPASGCARRWNTLAIRMDELNAGADGVMARPDGAMRRLAAA